MAFGRKKKVEEPKVDLEVPAEEIPEIQPKVVEKKVVKKAETKVEEPVQEVEQEVVQEVEQEIPEIETKKTAQIVSGELLDNGLHRYVIISNAPIGEVGQIDDLE